MNKLRKTQLKLSISIGIICFVSVLAIGVVVGYAYYSNTVNVPKIVNESGGIITYNEAQPQPQDQELGVASGTNHYQVETFWAGTSYGGALATSTSGSATTLKESELNKFSMIVMTPNVSSFSYTLPATSTLTSLLPSPGDSKTWTLINATTTTATTLTLVKGTGWNLTGVGTDVDAIAGAAWGSQVNMKVECERQLDTDILCYLTENIAVD